ncbi:MAG: hypothetical protein GX607_02620 [Myxococcales bacterium]|jgi:hypothetical protein|nr:hypothetical protein [Myxococcales bacterium]
MNHRLRARTPLSLVGAVALFAACGGKEPAAPPPVAVETPADEVLRIGERWTSTSEQRGLLSPPSPVSVFVVREVSEITLSPTSGREVLTIEEELELRDGGALLCQTRFEHPLTVRWGRRDTDAAVELRRPGVTGARQCQGGSHPEPTLERPARAARFVLRSDNLVAIEPPTDDRIYLPLP